MNKLILSTLVACTTLLTGCDLDKFPEDKITTDTAWESIEDAQRFRNGMYAYFRTPNGGKYISTPDFQTDLFNATISFSNRGGDMYIWSFSASQYDIEDTWQYNYVCINNCNNIIENIDKLELVDEDEIAEAANIKGEAHLVRAICYHALAVRFAKDYEPGSAATDLGLPLVEVVDPNAKPSRATLEDTYKLIKSDIAIARQNLTEQGRANATILTLDVADALEARVDLYMHNYSEAISLSEKLIGKYSLNTDAENLTNMFLNDESSEIIFRIFMSLDERANDLSAYNFWNTSTNSYSPDFIPAQWVVDLYEKDDIRKNVYFIQGTVDAQNITAENIYMLNKYPGNPQLKKSPDAYEYYNMPKLFRSAESYLIAAEAAYRNGDESRALRFLNDLRVKRSASALNVSGSTLFNAIKEEWIREFVGEGNRLNDLKRWHDGFKRHDCQNEAIVMPGAEYKDKSVEADNQKFVWEIPANDQKANTNLIPNWK